MRLPPCHPTHTCDDTLCSLSGVVMDGWPDDDAKKSEPAGAADDDLASATLETKTGTTIQASEALAGKTVVLYFSAHWCPPCKAFTPLLAKA